MALLTSIVGSGQPDAICSAESASQLSGMAFMYLLMSAFHSGPWLKLVSQPRHESPSNGERDRPAR